MKYIFFGITLLLSAWAVIAWRWRPEPPEDYRVHFLHFVLDAADTGVHAGAGPEVLRSLFDALDADGDGSLTGDEWPPDAEAPMDRLFAWLDADADGRVVFADFERIFDHLDQNGDGMLTLEDTPALPSVLVWLTDDAPIRRQQMALFEAYHPEYRVVLDPHNAGLEKVIVQCLAGVGPDVFDCYTGFQLNAFVHSGIAMDLTDEFAARGIDMAEIWPACHTVTFLDGRVYGHPGNASADAIWFNKDFFDEAGLPYPEPDWTWDGLVRTARALTVRDAAGRPLRYGLMTHEFDWQRIFVPQWGGTVYNEARTRCTLDGAGAQAGAQFFQDLIFQHRVTPSFSEETAMAGQGGWGQGNIGWFAGGRAAMAVGGRWWLAMLRDPAYAHLRLGVAPVPAGPVDRLIGIARSSLVNAHGRNVEGALAFVTFMHSRPWNELMNRQADGLGSVRKYHYGEHAEAFLHDAARPDEAYNHVWRDALERAVPVPISPFVIGQRAERVFKMQTDLFRTGQKSAGQAMVDTARDINRDIVEQLRADPALRERYMALVAQGAAPAWDSPGAAP